MNRQEALYEHICEAIMYIDRAEYDSARHSADIVRTLLANRIKEEIDDLTLNWVTPSNDETHTELYLRGQRANRLVELIRLLHVNERAMQTAHEDRRRRELTKGKS